MKIAVVGSGISGLVSAYLLGNEHEVTLFEANDYLGGHTATVDVELDGQHYAIDTGFIVFNDRTYPNFEKLLSQLDIARQPTEMSFSVSDKASDFEYNGHTVTSLFARKRNWFNPNFYRFIFEILRFNKVAKQYVAQTEQNEQTTLGEFLAEQGFSQRFCDYYLLPMGAAIWSMSVAEVSAFPLSLFLRFFNHHGLLDVVNRPQWYVIPGGSREYVRAISKKLNATIKLNSPVQSISREKDGISLVSLDQRYQFDEVIIASHSDQALRMLDDASEQEQQILSAIPYQNNEVVLHTDESILPKRKAAWASWNYRIESNAVNRKEKSAAVTYDMNILQGINSSKTFCVTLNDTEIIAKDKILRSFNYSHPVYDINGFKARKQRHEICGQRNTHFCGAYWYNGFHEDGVRSALDVCRRFGVSL